MSHEGMPTSSTGDEQHRAAGRRAIEAGWAGDIMKEQKEESLKSLVEEYQAAQRELVTLNEDLHTGNARVEKNPRMRELAILIGRDIQSKIDALQIKTDTLEQDIEKAGGNPSDFVIR